MAVTDEEELVASAVIYPGDTEEVQMIVIWANKYLVPLHPISMGRNCVYYVEILPEFEVEDELALTPLT